MMAKRLKGVCYVIRCIIRCVIRYDISHPGATPFRN